MSFARSMLSKASIATSIKFCRSAIKGQNLNYARLLSTVSSIQEKGLSEEVKYIRSMEAKSKAEMKAKLEAILDQEKNSDEKAQLMELLEEKKPSSSIISRLGLDDWKFALPIGILLAVPTLHYEVISFDAEMILTAYFILFCSTMYTQVGGFISKFLNDYRDEIKKQMNEVDETIRRQIKDCIASLEVVSDVEKDAQSVFEADNASQVIKADTLNHMEEHKYREAVVKKLESLVALEETALNSVRHRMVSKVHSEVVQTFKTDKKVRENALNQAIAVLAAGSGAKMGKDVVGEVFASSIANYRVNYAKLPEGSDPVLVQLKLDIEAIAVPPVLEGKGGNVFELTA